MLFHETVLKHTYKVKRLDIFHKTAQPTAPWHIQPFDQNFCVKLSRSPRQGIRFPRKYLATYAYLLHLKNITLHKILHVEGNIFFRTDEVWFSVRAMQRRSKVFITNRLVFLISNKPISDCIGAGFMCIIGGEELPYEMAKLWKHNSEGSWVHLVIAFFL